MNIILYLILFAIMGYNLILMVKGSKAACDVTTRVDKSGKAIPPRPNAKPYPTKVPRETYGNVRSEDDARNIEERGRSP